MKPGEVRELPSGAFQALPGTFAELLASREYAAMFVPDHPVVVHFPEATADRLREHIRAQRDASRKAERELSRAQP